MSPAPDRAVAILALLAPLLGAPVSARAQETLTPEPPETTLETFLEDENLRTLLARHLEREIRRLNGAEREQAAERLADLYVELIETAETDDQRRIYEARSRALLQMVPNTDSFDLRLSLSRAAYARAERLAERWRLRAADASARLEALRTFRELAPRLAEVGAAADRRVEELRRQEERALDQDLGLLDQFESEARRQRSLAMYLAAWCNTYIAELTDEPAHAERALRQFGYLLNAPTGQPASLGRAPVSTLQYEHVARAALGAGVCEALRGDVSAGLSWLDTVDAAENVAAPVRVETFARRLTLLARSDRWDEFTRAVGARRRTLPADDRALSPVEARLVAVLALEAVPADDRERVRQRDLAETGMTDLLARGEVGQVVELARLYGPAALGGEGPRVERARGMIAYEEARRRHEQIDPIRAAPPRDPEIVARYADAVDHLRAALAADAASLSAAARSSVELLLGLSLYHSTGRSDDRQSVARLLEAADALDAAAGRLPDAPRAAEARLAAVRAAQTAMDRAPASDAPRERWRALATRFIDLYPAHPSAGSVMIRLAEYDARRSADAAEQALATLLRVPRTDAAWESARRRAARMLYDLWRDAPPDRRAWAALRYVEVAEPLLALDVPAALDGDPPARTRALTRGRRLLAAMLSTTSVDPVVAMRLLATVRRVAETDAVRAEPALDAELAFRAAQIALLEGDRTLAAARVDDVVAAAPESRWADAAERLLLSRAIDDWRDAKRIGARDEERTSEARRVVAEGVRVLERRRTQNETPDLAVLSGVAEAAFDLWRAEREPAARTLAISLHRRLLEREPNARDPLRRLAHLSRAAGDLDSALEAWRILLAGLPPGSGAWWEARVESLEILLRTDRDAARAALRQHDVLRPASPPDEWAARMKTVREALGVEPPPAGVAAP